METMTDNDLKSACFNAMVERVGYVDTERFIVLMNQNPLDYTEWRKTQFCNEGSVRELAKKIKAFTAARKASA